MSFRLISQICLKPTHVMKSSVYILLITLSPAPVAAEKIPLKAFLSDMRYQLYAMTQADNQQAAQAAIKNIHVEMNVVVEKDPQGRPVYYVLDGIVDKKDVVTQTISFDMELKHNATAKTGDSGRRVYSTRKRDYPYGPDRYPPPSQYPAYPGRYMPDIYPVILFDKHQ